MSVKNLKSGFILITMALNGCHETKKDHKDPKIGEGTVVAESYDGESCPSSEGQWKSFWKKSFIDLRSSNYAKAKSVALSENLTKCQNSLTQFPLAKACVSNMSNFVSSQRQQMRPGYSMGFKLSDREYYKGLPDPSMLDLPESLKSEQFLKYLDDDDDTLRLKGHAYIEELNRAIANPSEKMISLTFHSNHLSSIDDSRTSGRFLVFVPGDKIDRFYQFAIREVKSVPISNSVSLISIQKKSLETNHALDRPIAYFADLWRQRDGDKFTITTRLNETKKLENCYLCHKSALINIYPEQQRFSESLFGSRLNTVNERISEYAKATIAHLDTSDFGPILGAENSSVRTDSFLKACSKGKIEHRESLQRISQAMNCHSCHDGVKRGALNFNINEALEYGGTMIGNYVQKYKLMPPNADLSDLEREVLVQCLEEEYMGSKEHLGAFDRWILNEPNCSF